MSVVIINKISFAALFSSLVSGLNLLKNSPVLYLGISALWMSIFAGLFFMGAKLPGNIYIWVMFSLLLALIYPLIIGFTVATVKLKTSSSGADTATNGSLEHTAESRKRGSLLLSLSGVCTVLLQGYTLRLIVNYLLLVVSISLATSYLEARYPVHLALINGISFLAFLVMQILLLIALPSNIMLDGAVKPFHALFYALKSLCLNFLQYLMLFLGLGLSFLLILALAYGCSKLIGAWAILIYIIGLWLLLTWVNLSIS